MFQPVLLQDLWDTKSLMQQESITILTHGKNEIKARKKQKRSISKDNCKYCGILHQPCQCPAYGKNT